MQRLRFLAAVAAASLISLPALAAPKVIASLTQPRGGLDCERAADEAKVVFDFRQPRSDVKRISVYVDGEGVREQDIDQEWPTLTVLHGLHAGRNTVEAVATDKNGKATSHKLVVLIGERPKPGERDAAIVDCVDHPKVASRDEPPGNEPWGEVLDDEGDVLDEDDYDEVVDEVVYDDGPRYVYSPYPAYVVYAPVYYYPWPYYYSNYYYPYHRHSYYYGGGGYYRSYDRHYDRPGRAYRSSSGRYDSSGWHDAPRRYEPSRPMTHSSAGSAYRQSDAQRSAPSHYDGPRSAPSHSSSRGEAYRGGGDRNRSRQ